MKHKEWMNRCKGCMFSVEENYIENVNKLKVNI
jgi:hypothetical protein